MDIGKKFVASNGVLGEAADDVTILQGGSRNPVMIGWNNCTYRGYFTPVTHLFLVIYRGFFVTPFTVV